MQSLLVQILFASLVSLLVQTITAAGGESSPDSAAVKQLLHVVEGLEEELFSSEARRNDAEVCLACILACCWI